MSTLHMIPVQPDAWAWFGETPGQRLTEIPEHTFRSLVRYARQNYACDIIPVIREYVTLDEPNAYHDDVLATIEYSSTGACSAVGGHLDADGHILWSCYAD